MGARTRQSKHDDTAEGPLVSNSVVRTLLVVEENEGRKTHLIEQEDDQALY